MSSSSSYLKIPSRRSGWDGSVGWPLLIAHVFGIGLAPFTFSWVSFIVFLALAYITGFGVTAGAHRLFTHETYKAGKLMEWILAILFVLSAQGSLYRWVRDHYIHHKYADGEGDPHSPVHDGKGFLHAQVKWLWQKPPTKAEARHLYEKYAPSLKDRPWAKTLSTSSVITTIHLSFIAMLYIVGALYEVGFRADFLITGWFTGLSFVVWGALLRIVYTLHVTNLVNSASHLWGYKTYELKDNSRNNWWVALLVIGEGWHNNHHSRPAAANQGFHKWWEFDMTFCVLLVLGALGLIRDMKVYRPKLNKTELWFPSKKND